MAIIGSCQLINPRRERMDDADVRAILSDLGTQIASELGAQFIDPSAEVAAAGREAALDAGGASVHHYSPEFYPVLGLSLLDKIMQEAGVAARYRSSGADSRMA